MIINGSGELTLTERVVRSGVNVLGRLDDFSSRDGRYHNLREGVAAVESLGVMLGYGLCVAGAYALDKVRHH